MIFVGGAPPQYSFGHFALNRPMARDRSFQVSLDGAATKSEDYQRGIRRRAAQPLMTASN
jgi:hypothetical protein